MKLKHTMLINALQKILLWGDTNMCRPDIDSSLLRTELCI